MPTASSFTLDALNQLSPAHHDGWIDGWMDGGMDGGMMVVNKKYFFIGFQFLRVTEVVG
jgi:hypothetical protein